ncbi:uncharacterized protein N7506_007924 [Penicillium brevicompactum]|uniref:uncharacterized protein n=1 Tax=Penicillium brevicompactum TaxID=5074 RepID=UPI002540DAA4|nr:uncharacterized protein N7506_007924 [Penicillium brevicompactum]KAJ5334141.1 hypothetical protein N7506_007924 [Penicillium brevicompactum]
MRSTQFIAFLQLAFAGNMLASATIPLVSTEFGTVFDAPMKIGNQSFQMLVDTGSSDTYVMENGYTCINATTNGQLPQEDCLYANKTYRSSRTQRRIANENFGIEYGAGIASGFMAYEQVSLGNLTVKKQKVGIANRSNPTGDGVNSGLLGLAYPSITSAHPGNQTDNTTYWYNRLPYDPLVNTMHKQGLIEPYFSLALARSPRNQSTAFGGYLTLGGLPPVSYIPEFSVMPVEIMDLPSNFTSGKGVRSYWATTVKGATFGVESNNITTVALDSQAFVDSGNYITYLPASIVDKVNGLFSPPAVFNEELQAALVDCAAEPPKFGLTIGNQTFFHNGSDLLFQISDGVCVSSLVASEKIPLDISVNVLGVSFLKNVLTVFDFGRNEMRFSKLLDVGRNQTRLTSNGTQSPGISSGVRRSLIPSWGFVTVLISLGLTLVLGL